MAQFVATCAVMALAQAIYVAVGFGSGLVALGSLALIALHPVDVVLTLLLVSIPSEAVVIAQSWREIAWRQVAALGAGVAVGTILGTHFLQLSSPGLLLRTLAVLLLVSGVAFLATAKRVATRDWPGWAQLPVGLASGVLGGLLGAGGPPLIIYYRLVGANKAAFRGNLMAIFLVTTVVRFGASLWEGLITAPRVISAALLMPACLAGVWLGRHVHHRLNEAQFRQTVSVGLIAIGFSLLLR